MTRKGSAGVNAGAGSAPAGPGRQARRWGAAGVALAATVGAGLGGASAAAADPVVTIPVPCSVQALSSAISGAPSDAILSLQKGCFYGLSAALPEVTSNLTIQGNRDAIASVGGGDYTALTVDGAQLDINQLTMRGFTGASNLPGALKNNDGTLTITNSTFAGNGGNRGGAILNDQGGMLAATSTNFIDNDASRGAGVYNRDYSTATLGSDTFLGNEADAGGAVYITSGHVTVTGTSSSTSGSTSFVGNEATADSSVVTGVVRPDSSASGGGAIDNEGGVLTVTFANFAHNEAEGSGGAIRNDGGTDTVSMSGFTGNLSHRNGGAIATNMNLNLSSDTVSENRADDDGGGIYVDGSAATSLNKTDVYGNSAGDEGGGIYRDSGTVSLTNQSLVTLNEPNNCTGLSC